jgi:hypothetical protein
MAEIDDEMSDVSLSDVIDSELVKAMRSLRERKLNDDESVSDALDVFEKLESEFCQDMLEEKEGLGTPTKKITPIDTIR